MTSVKISHYACASVFCIFASAPAGAADLVGTSYNSRTTTIQTTRYVAEECFLLRVTQAETNEIVQTCYPPLDLNPRRGPSAGASAGTDIATVRSYSVQD